MIRVGPMLQIYRCGWCGFPTDAEGKALPLTFNQANAYLAETANATVIKTNGSCCPNGDGSYAREDYWDLHEQ